MSITRVLSALLLLAPAVAGAQATCSPDTDEIRRQALNALMQSDGAQVLPMLDKLLERRDECSSALRRQAVELLARSREPERIEIMLRVARTDPSSMVRRQAVQSLGQVNTDRSTALLDSIFTNATDSEVAELALRGLANQSNPAARASLRRIAESATIPTEQRARAVNYLGSGRRMPEDVKYLMDLYGKTSGPELRQAIVRSLANQRTTESMSWLMGIARDRNQEIELRQVALRNAVSANGGPGALEIKDLLAIYDEFARQPDMQEQLLDVLGQRPESAATDKLIQIASDEGNVTLRRRAVQRLGQRHDPKVRQFLLDMVSK